MDQRLTRYRQRLIDLHSPSLRGSSDSTAQVSAGGAPNGDRETTNRTSISWKMGPQNDSRRNGPHRRIDRGRGRLKPVIWQYVVQWISSLALNTSPQMNCQYSCLVVSHRVPRMVSTHRSIGYSSTRVRQHFGLVGNQTHLGEDKSQCFLRYWDTESSSISPGPSWRYRTNITRVTWLRKARYDHTSSMATAALMTKGVKQEAN
jgi:hypothetical protein